MRHRLLSAVVLGCALLWMAAPVLTWGVDGHRIVARIALTQMTPETTRVVQDLLGAEDFVSVSTWADDIRAKRPETAGWHVVSIPYDAYGGYDASRDCPPSDRGDCVVAELDRLKRTLADTGAAKDQRAEALKFAIHFIADLHQPLRTIDNRDHHGEDVRVVLAGTAAAGAAPSESSSLLSVWDTVLIRRRGLDEAAYSAQLLQDIRTSHPSALPINFVKWVEDTHQVAVEYVYAYPAFKPGGPPQDAVTLSADYQKRAYLAIDHQLEVAGVRLAALLNSTLSKQP